MCAAHSCGPGVTAKAWNGGQQPRSATSGSSTSAATASCCIATMTCGCSEMSGKRVSFCYESCNRDRLRARTNKTPGSEARLHLSACRGGPGLEAALQLPVGESQRCMGLRQLRLPVRQQQPAVCREGLSGTPDNASQARMSCAEGSSRGVCGWYAAPSERSHVQGAM